jgi:betaine-aldehyde dehydrogenase
MNMLRVLPEKTRENGFFINGERNAGVDCPRLDRVSPGYGVKVSSVVLCSSDDVDAAVRAARHAFETDWGDASGSRRGRILIDAANAIRLQLEELAYWETLETGKPISQSRAEIEAAADHYEAAGGLARMITGETHNGYGQSMLGLVTKQPIGVVALITPWNFPFTVLAERLPFILAAGCTVILKPSELTSTSSLMLAEILTEVGLPKGVFNVVTGLGPVVGEALSTHSDVDMISFTGSLAVGERVLDKSKSNLKKVALELGGKNPQIVFADADLDDAADGVVFGLFFNWGQFCVSGSRVIV